MKARDNLRWMDSNTMSRVRYWTSMVRAKPSLPSYVVINHRFKNLAGCWIIVIYCKCKQEWPKRWGLNVRKDHDTLIQPKIKKSTNQPILSQVLKFVWQHVNLKLNDLKRTVNPWIGSISGMTSHPFRERPQTPRHPHAGCRCTSHTIPFCLNAPATPIVKTKLCYSDKNYCVYR